MTDIEQWEPSSTSEALATLDSVTVTLERAATIDEVREARSMAEIAMAYVRRHDESQGVILRAQEIMRTAERKLAELMTELKAEGKVRGAGRPKKSATDSQDSDAIPANDSQISARDVFGDDKAQRDANLFASVNEDEWAEALAAARESGDMSRAALVRMLRTPRGERAERSANGDIATAGRVVPRAINAIRGAADALEAFMPEGIEHDDRKEWKAALKAETDRVTAWTRALPR